MRCLTISVPTATPAAEVSMGNSDQTKRPPRSVNEFQILWAEREPYVAIN